MLDTYHPYTVYLCEQGYEDPWLFVVAKTGPRAKNVGETLIYKCVRKVAVQLGYGTVRVQACIDARGHRFPTNCISAQPFSERRSAESVCE
jgi:hypothetical protein